MSFAEIRSKSYLKKSEKDEIVPENSYFCTMILYNTTYQMPVADARDFVIWVHQVMLPQVHSFGHLRNGRLSRILSHKEEDSECFALQFEVESTARLHYWLLKQGKQLGEELTKTFNNRVLGFSTIMEVITESEREGTTNDE